MDDEQSQGDPYRSVSRSQQAGRCSVLLLLFCFYNILFAHSRDHAQPVISAHIYWRYSLLSHEQAVKDDLKLTL